MTQVSSPAGKPRRSPRKKATGAVPAQERQERVAEAAYYRAEKRGFSGGGELDDWLQAEQEIDRQK